MRAPIHLIFNDSQEQRLLLDGLARHLGAIFGATPCYDFLTQIAAFDSPIATYLDQEIRELKNYPIVCQSLQAVASITRFDWNAGTPYRDLFQRTPLRRERQNRRGRGDSALVYAAGALQ